MSPNEFTVTCKVVPEAVADIAVSPVAVTALAQTGEPKIEIFLSKTISTLVLLVALAEEKAGAVPAVTVIS